jgi:ketosteroid isomerase-like protein
MLFCLPVMKWSGLALVLIAVQAAQPAMSQDLARIVAAERAFAAATKEIGVRDGFLTFFTDDAIDVAPAGGGLALIRLTDRLRAQPQPALPLTRQLLWEPRWGAISSAGDLGWLTGPYTMHDTTGADRDRHGAYFSIWRRQPDGTYKVRLDIGIATARAVAFSEGFMPAPAPAAPDGGAPSQFTPDDLRLIDARFAQAAGRDVGGAYRAHLLPAARLHRNERSPFAGADAAAGFMASTFASVTWTVLHAEVSASGDLGFTAGSYDAAAKASEGRPESSERGFFVRVWHRDSSGAWRIAFETNGIR